MSKLQDVLDCEKFKKRFKLTSRISQQFNNSQILSKGILGSEIIKLLEEEELTIPSSKKANSCFAFTNLNAGLNISWNHGATNEDYLSVLLFDPKKLNKKLGHSQSYLETYPEISRKHKILENRHVLRINGDLNTEEVRYILFRKKHNEVLIYRSGIDTNLDVTLINSSKGENSNSNIILGEYHFKTKDKIIQEEVITDLNGLEVIISETLGEIEITGNDDLKMLKKKKEFNPAFKEDFKHNSKYNTSKSYLIDLFEKYQIPILGIGNFQTQIKSQIQELYKSDNQTLSLIGRSHISEIEKLSKKFRTYIPNYDLKSHIN